MKWLFCCTALLWTLTCLATTRTDTVVLYNGQVLIGEIKGVKGGMMSIDDEDLGVIRVKLYKIKKARSPRQYRIVTISKEEWYGSLEPAGIAGHIYITLNHQDSAIMLAVENINIMQPLETKFLKRLNGNVSLGFSYTKSSSIGQLNLSSSVTYATKLLENSLSASAMSTIDSGAFSRDNESVEMLSVYNFSPTWVGALILNYQRNLELSIARRFQQTVSAGNKLLVRKNCELLALSGLAFNEERSTSGEDSKLLLEIPVSLRFALYQFNHPNIQLTTTQAGFISLSQKGRIRYSGNITLYIELLNDFYINISSYSSYDSKPPESNSNQFDFGVTFGISYKF